MTDTVTESPWDLMEVVRIGDHETTVARRFGDARPSIIMCHSIALDLTIWDSIVRLLPPELDVVAFNARRHDQNPSPPFTFEGAVSDLNDLILTKGLEQPHLVGVSMGGAIVQEYAATHPDSVGGMSLLATSDRGGPAAIERSKIGGPDAGEARLDATVQRWFSQAALSASPAYVKYAEQRVLSWSDEAWSETWQALGTREGRVSELARLEAPILWVLGDEDASIPVDRIQRVVSELRQGRLVVTRGSHLFVLEDPQGAADLIAGQQARIQETWRMA